MPENKKPELFLIVQCLDKDENLRTLYIHEFTFEKIKAKSVKEGCDGYLSDIIFDFVAETVEEIVREIERRLEFKVMAIRYPDSENFVPYND